MVTMEAAGMVSKRVEAAAWVGATVAVTRVGLRYCSVYFV